MAKVQGPAIEPWMQRLKAAYDAGYYREESSLGQQTPIPWARLHCAQCPFFAYGTCAIRAVARPPYGDTCRYFSPNLYDEGVAFIADHDEHERREWWGHNGANDL